MAVLGPASTAVSITLTIGREPGASAQESLANLLSVWHGAFSQAAWMGRFRKKRGLLGNVRAIEVTIPDDGWHWHIHAVLVFAREGLLYTAMDEFTDRWLSAARRAGLNALGANQHWDILRSLDDRERTAGYLTQQSAIRQNAHRGPKWPGDLLHEVALTGLADPLDRLVEFQEATFRKSKIGYSHGWDRLAS